jgi:BRCA1-associated protein
MSVFGRNSVAGGDGDAAAADTAAVFVISSSKKKKNHGSIRCIRKRPVSFGNPALGTYHGNIYTLEEFDSRTTNDGDRTAASAAAILTDDCERAVSGINQRDNNNNDNNELRTILTHSSAIRGSRSSRNDQQSSATKTALVEGAVQCSQADLVAMVDVPPEQVPEGILNLARSHRPWINHVRIVIAEKPMAEKTGLRLEQLVDDDDETGENDGNERKDDTEKAASSSAAAAAAVYDEPYPHVSAAENAASILAAEQDSMLLRQQQSSDEEHEQRQSDKKSFVDVPLLSSSQPGNNMVLRDSSSFTISNNNDEQQQQQRSERTYVVLLELCSEEATQQLIQDLHRKPYTSLDETQVCSIYPVVALQGTDGVSLQSPFFASSSSTPPPPPNACSSTNKSSTATTTSAATSVPSLHHHHQLNHHQEDYNCPVCLERMDLNDGGSSKDNQSPTNNGGNYNNNATTTTATNSGIFTTVCNHSFHLDCLLKWQDSPCPVCRFDHSGLNEALSQCHVCGTTENNYVCLICGVVSCGGNTMNAATTASAPSEVRRGESGGAVDHPSSSNNSGSDVVTHARQHYNETLHAYALDTHTQHVWDFCGQGYVHRLLQNKEDGKLVEVPDPSNTTSQERSLNPGLSDEQEGEVVHRKLEGMASAYYTLLKSQLEQQRIFYEGRLEEIRRDYNETTTTASSASSAQKNGRDSGGGSGQGRKKKASDLIAALKQERHQLSQRLVLLQSRRNKVKEDASFLISMNESLEKNKDSFRDQVIQAQQQRQEVRRMLDECLPPLQENVTRLMLQLESESLSQQSAKEACKKPAGSR